MGGVILLRIILSTYNSVCVWGRLYIEAHLIGPISLNQNLMLNN